MSSSDLQKMLVLRTISRFIWVVRKNSSGITFLDMIILFFAIYSLWMYGMLGQRLLILSSFRKWLTFLATVIQQRISQKSSE